MFWDFGFIALDPTYIRYPLYPHYTSLFPTLPQPIHSHPPPLLYLCTYIGLMAIVGSPSFPSLSFESRLVIVLGLWRVELGWPASGDPFAVSVVIPLCSQKKKKKKIAVFDFSHGSHSLVHSGCFFASQIQTPICFIYFLSFIFYFNRVN